MKNFIRRHSSTFLILLVLVLAGTTWYFYKHSQLSQNPASANDSEAKALAAKVGKLIVLPTDEIPTIATVSDPSALKDQAFFADAKVGDKVLIYSNAKKAILYSPSLNKIITVAPLNIGDQKIKPPTTTTPPPTTSTPSKDKNKF